LIKTLSFPTDLIGPAWFLDDEQVLLAGPKLTVMNMSQYLATEAWDQKLSSSLAVALSPGRRRVYMGIGPGGDILTLQAEGPECQPPQNGLAAFFPGDGVPHDVVGGAATTVDGDLRYSPGRVGQAFLFDGKSRMAIATIGYSQFGASDMSVAMYAKFARMNGQMTLMDRTSSDGAIGIRLLKTTDQHIVFEFATRRNSPVRLTSSTVVEADRWYHLCVTKDDLSVALYVNGIEQDRRPLKAVGDLTLDQDLAPVQLGGTKDRRAAFAGKLDEILFYSRALTAAEVQMLYTLRESGSCRI
jgi:hypothetical protein